MADTDADYQDVARAGAELALVVGLIEFSHQTQDDTWPEEVKENFREMVGETVESINTRIMEFMRFGEAYDQD